MSNKVFFSIGILLAGLFLFSCVPARKFGDMKTAKENCETSLEECKAQNNEINIKLKELETQFELLKKQSTGLVNDTTVMGISLRTIKTQYNDIEKLNKTLQDKLKEQLKGNQAEQMKLLEELEQARIDLQKKQDALFELESELNQKQANIDKSKAELEAKNKRLAELERKLTYNDSIVNALKDKVSAALLGFEGDGLTIEQKNGKVYVSLDEKLLFKSGRWDVDPKGQTALKNLAGVLEKNEDINIVIEGHTDDLAYGGNGNIQDNWDLSVKRATAIVKIILSNSKVDAKRLTASGRGEFMPIDDSKTKDARAKNRRTEIILTPKLDELFRILESN
ncbi:MAG: OmpA family protein [Bacteroidales bacterium]|nr:OmpA family protein [Bacteroidales bacterium]